MNSENQNIAQSTPPQITNPFSEITPVPTPPKKVSVLGIVLVVFFLFLLFGGAGVSAALVAYDKVTLPSSEVQSAIRQAVLSLSFAPKTATYVIEKSAIATSTVASGTLDASIAISSPSLLSVTGSNNLDVFIKGSFDTSDPANIQSQFTLKAEDLLAADIKAVNKKIYLKVHNFPTKLIAPFIPISQEIINSEFSHWIVWDTHTLDTEARALIDKNSQTKNKTSAQVLTDVLRNKTIMSKISLTTETLDGVSVYRLHPNVDEEFVKAYVSEFGNETDKQKLDSGSWLDSFNNINVDIFVDKNTYHVTKMTLRFASQQNSSLLAPVLKVVPGMSSGDVEVAAVLKLSDYNKPLRVEAPTDTKNWEDVFSEITQAMFETSEPLMVVDSHTPERARDDQRRSDLLSIKNAVYLFAAEHNGNLPVTTTAAFPTKEMCIGTSKSCFDLAHAGKTESFIVPDYIASIPKDPRTGTQENTRYTIFIDPNGELQVNAVSEVNRTEKIAN